MTNSSQNAIISKLERILPLVKEPGRYIGGETNQVVKNPNEILANMALVFPDIYEIGMSHNGTKVLYHVINREKDLAVERAFTPALDFAEQLRKNNLRLYTLESFTPICEFSAIGISLQTELNYTNVPFLLELGGVRAFSKDRADKDPFVIGGGPCMANPEPIADFFDLFVIGDGEILAASILRVIGLGRKEGLTRLQILEKLAQLKGIYVPALLPVKPNKFSEMIPEFDMAKGSYDYSKGIKRTWVEVLNKDDYPINNIVPNMNLIHDRFAVEVMRGCTQGCRFCQAGYWYRPNRELNADDVIDLAKKGLEATGENTLGLLSLSTADYGQVGKVTDYILQEESFENVDISLPSLRANSFGQTLATKISVIGNNRSATFAPETGSERIRKMINKTISDQDMYDAAESVFKNGFHNIKLYTMVGMPTENLDDMEAFCQLISNLCRIGKKYNPKNTVHPNIGILIPKPFTPMQWVGFMEEEKVWKHIKYVLDYFRGNKNVKITWADWKLAHVEAFYSRGDRSISALIYKAYQRGMILETFSENFNYAGWKSIWEEAGFNFNRVYENRDLEEILPWDFIHAGTSKSYLKAEYKKMLDTSSAEIPDCKWGSCQHCGIPGNYEDIKLSEEPNKYQSAELTIEQIKELSAQRKQRERTVYNYKITFAKTGLAKFLAHHATMDLFEKALRRMKVTLNHSQGFNPKPIIKNAGALPIGLESACEMILVETMKPIEGGMTDVAKTLSSMMHLGITVSKIELLDRSKLPWILRVDYRLKNADLPIDQLKRIISEFENKSLSTIVENRGKKIVISNEIEKISLSDNDLLITAQTNESGATVSPYVLFAGLLNTTTDAARSWSIIKERIEV